MRVRLTHTRGSRTGEVQVVDVAAGAARLGRRPDNDVVFDEERDRACSGHHCELVFRAGQVHVRDLGSANGTYVNEERVRSPTPLRTGDVLGLGVDGPRMEVSVGSEVGGTIRLTSKDVEEVARPSVDVEVGSASAAFRRDPQAARRRAWLATLGLVLVAAAILGFALHVALRW